MIGKLKKMSLVMEISSETINEYLKDAALKT
jgi:hypothetical protein